MGRANHTKLLGLTSILVTTYLGYGCTNSRALREASLRIEHLENNIVTLSTERDRVLEAEAKLAQHLKELADTNDAAKLVVHLRGQVEDSQQTLTMLSREHQVTQRSLELAQSDGDTMRRKNESLEASLQTTRQELENAKAMIHAMDNPLVVTAILESRLIQKLQGCGVYSQDSDRRFLGVLDFTGHQVDSIFNEAGLQGSPHAVYSIWNEHSLTGSPYAIYSPNNQYTVSPPLIVCGGGTIGALTVNQHYGGHTPFSPVNLKALSERTQGKYANKIRSFVE